MGEILAHAVVDQYRAAIADGTHVKLKGTSTRTARTVALEAGAGARGPILIEVDGEQIGQLPATFSVLPGALLLVS